MKRRSRRWRAVLALVATATMLALALRAVDTARLAVLGTELRWGWVAAAAALVPVQVLLAATRWRRVSNRLGQALSRRLAVEEYALSTLLNGLLPAGVGGDALRIWRRRRGGFVTALQAAVVERWTGQLCLAVVAVLSAAAWPALAPQAPRSAGLLPALIVVLAVLATLPLLPRALPGLGALARAAHQGALSDWPALAGLSLSLLASFVVGFLAAGLSLGHPPGVELLLAIPVLLVAMAVPLGVGGWGPRELTAVTVLPLFGWTRTDAFALSALYGLACLVGAIPGAIVPLRTLADELRHGR